MAAALFNRLADTTRVRAVSAGLDPGKRIHPEVLAVMQEIGIDLSKTEPTKLTLDLCKGAQLLITLGCESECPRVPVQRRFDWPIGAVKGLDPNEITRTVVRRMR